MIMMMMTMVMGKERNDYEHECGMTLKKGQSTGFCHYIN